MQQVVFYYAGQQGLVTSATYAELLWLYLCTCAAQLLLVPWLTICAVRAADTSVPCVV
jgi:hypothetical protein